MTRRIIICCALALIAGGAVARAAGSLRIVPIVRDDTVVVSFELADAYTDDLRDTIASGLRTTFSYDVELRMIVPAWVDRTIATAVVTTAVAIVRSTQAGTIIRSSTSYVNVVRRPLAMVSRTSLVYASVSSNETTTVSSRTIGTMRKLPAARATAPPAMSASAQQMMILRVIDLFLPSIPNGDRHGGAPE